MVQDARERVEHEGKPELEELKSKIKKEATKVDHLSFLYIPRNRDDHRQSLLVPT